MENSIKLIRKNNRAKNEQVVEKALWENKEIKAMRESFKKKFGKDFKNETEFPVHESNFNWSAVAAKYGTTIKEADSGSNFTQVLRAGVQTLVNRSYQVVETSFEDWVHTVQSSRDTELYAPLHGISFIREVGKQELYPESRAAGLDIKLKNRKYGTLYAVEKELLEDDQTGQFQQQASLLGEYCKIGLEVLCMAKLASVSGMSYGGMSIPTTETKPSDESTYPWSTSLVGGGANRPSSYSILTSTSLQAGYIGLMNQKNLLGLKMLAKGNRLLIGPAYNFDAAVLLHSAYFPSVPSTSAGATGTNFADNPVKGLASLTVSRFMFKNDGTVAGDSKAWYLMDDSVPWFVLQIRQAAEVVQENPQSGESFDRDVLRFKVSFRANADHIDPRFAWQGNDGSVTS